MTGAPTTRRRPDRGVPQLAWLALGAFLAPSPALGDDSALGLADLPAYREALTPNDAAKEAAPRVGFRDLWSHPEKYKGRRVQVEGRVVRRFRQQPIGKFPALVEAWAVSPAGDPFCLVFPATSGKSEPGPATVRFEGTFLKLIRYQGGDVARLAPLLVGPRAPVPAPAQSSPRQGGNPAGSDLDWVIGAIAAVAVVAVLAWHHAQRPFRNPSPAELGPPPCFEPTPTEHLSSRPDEPSRDDAPPEIRHPEA
jgi:hypothetical protein